MTDSKIYNKLKNDQINFLRFGMMLGGTSTMINGFVLCKLTSTTFREIRQTTKCCNIIRNTIFYTCTAPMLMILTMISYHITTMIMYENYKETIHDQRNN